jgi:hypothetical protein
MPTCHKAQVEGPSSNSEHFHISIWSRTGLGVLGANLAMGFSGLLCCALKWTPPSLLCCILLCRSLLCRSLMPMANMGVLLYGLLCCALKCRSLLCRSVLPWAPNMGSSRPQCWVPIVVHTLTTLARLLQYKGLGSQLRFPQRICRTVCLGRRMRSRQRIFFPQAPQSPKVDLETTGIPVLSQHPNTRHHIHQQADKSGIDGWGLMNWWLTVNET